MKNTIFLPIFFFSYLCNIFFKNFLILYVMIRTMGKIEIESHKLFVRGNVKPSSPVVFSVTRVLDSPATSPPQFEARIYRGKIFRTVPWTVSWLRGHVCALWCDVRAYMHGIGEKHGTCCVYV